MDPSIVGRIQTGERKLSMSTGAMLRGEHETGHAAAIEAYHLFAGLLNNDLPEDMGLHCYSRLATTLNLIGIACNNTQQYEAGASAFTDALEIWENFIKLGHDESFNVLIGQSNLAFSRAGLGLRKQAIELLTVSIEGLRKLRRNDTAAELIRCLSGLAGVLVEDRQPSVALRIIDEAISLTSAQSGSELALASAYNTKGKILREMGDLQQSCAACEQAIHLLADVGGSTPTGLAHYMEIFLNNYRETVAAARIVESASIRRIARAFLGNQG